MFDFGLTEDQFWELTYAKFQALSKRYEESVKLEDHRAGVIASIICNVQPGIEKARVPSDFFPLLKAARKKKKQTPEQQLAMMEALFGPRPVKG